MGRSSEKSTQYLSFEAWVTEDHCSTEILCIPLQPWNNVLLDLQVLKENGGITLDPRSHFKLYTLFKNGGSTVPSISSSYVAQT